MMMCRLLCALLVLALCCCSSNASDTELAEQDSSQKTMTTTATQATTLTLGQSGPKGEESGGEKGNTAVLGDGGVTTVPGPQLNVTSNVLATEVKNGMTGTKSDTSTAAEKAGQNAEASAKTTTTTTQTPTKTTTTTTAPEAPSTTTQATTTTTTSAPSRLREVDGSLGSSAWVCAPLLLAVSALAYTAVG
ncbi:putative mucin TcMUCII [Trypanosoma cruzi]|uniref:Mucin TcMUCII, putative n=2 Tax=Trypanosoma cruzi TaxID=5693 RepID=Q4DTZ1_TRYCC|nr:mucin TcMUCII, putative [Trypanosoma cruzi]EAN95998.1 mucin TcMUCII, putative [Trypanosoma cruzi]PWV03486.1 putative mucin TcMUCII [Trypanosoma cruzi]|eukprot:XP_817849.1 mucin TcMUCII [Trypanosoma cruzi strain CL Brener]